MKKITAILITIFYNTILFAQQNNEVEMADALFESGKIYVVVTVLSVIFLGITIYLILLDRKIGKIEKEQNKQ